ncbi:hypothetical protein SDC9_184849 [bioreactor metagenome]|uniref:Uncharacterized protein n=1 Tax=bioreactor metagenome TaxID=1076179 RepID=A0A645HPP0_9ZZZZ
MLTKVFRFIITTFPSLPLVYFVSSKVALFYMLFSDLSNSILLNISRFTIKHISAKKRGCSFIKTMVIYPSLCET